MRYIIILLINISLLFADSYEIKLYEQLFPKIFSKKKINVFTDANKKYFEKSKILKLTSLKDADILVLYNSIINTAKPIFTTSYIDYINSNSIGAFYWKKGRPQLILNKQNLLKYNLKIDDSLKKYLK